MKNIINDIRRGFFDKEHFWKRLVIVVVAVIMMGFALSFLILVNMGTDPCTMMNRAISAKLGMSFGNPAQHHTVGSGGRLRRKEFGIRHIGEYVFGRIFDGFLFMADPEMHTGRDLYGRMGEGAGICSGFGSFYPCGVRLYGCGYGNGSL